MNANTALFVELYISSNREAMFGFDISITASTVKAARQPQKVPNYIFLRYVNTMKTGIIWLVDLADSFVFGGGLTVKCVAFFRGINVGGKNIVKMSELRQLFNDLGFQDVTTYIQSGNVIFTSDLEQHKLVPLIEDRFIKQFAFQSAVVIRSSAEIVKIVASLPFEAVEIEQAVSENPAVEHLYIYLSNDPFDIEMVSRICASYNGKDKYQIINRELYLLCFQSIRDSKLAALFTKLPQPPTARNLKTLNKIMRAIQ